MLLLDTHVLLWIAIGSSHLGPEARRLIDRASAVHVSAVSGVELALKQMLGKIRLPRGFESWLQDSGFLRLPLTWRHAEELARFPSLTGHDPFDRMLLAQAASERLIFVTGDQRVLQLRLDGVLDAGR